MSAMTLTADATYKPVGLVPMRDAVARIAAEQIAGTNRCQAIISDESRRFRSKHLDIPAPLVVVNFDYVELEPKDLRRVSRRVLFARDRFTCQYCGWVAPSNGSGMRELTVDHVKPQRLFANRAEATTWDNCVAACRECNERKGGRLPMECGMMPATTPKAPHYVQLRFAGRLAPAQRDYVAEYFKLKERDGVHI